MEISTIFHNIQIFKNTTLKDPADLLINIINDNLW